MTNVYVKVKKLLANKPTVVKILFVICVAACASSFVAAPFALLGGFLFTLFFGHPLPALGTRATSMLLKVSVVGLGFSMNAHSALEAGKDGLYLTIGSIILVLTLGWLLGRAFKLPTKMSYLVSSGTAICGGSAIAAVAPTVNANEREISVALGVVFLLNSVALFVFPAVGHMLDLNQHDFGLWSAIAIHDTSSVVGAASAYGEEAMVVATTVKLARALWIIPLAIFSTFIFHSKNKKIKIPWFIGFFILAMLANTYIPMVGAASPFIFVAAKSMLVVTLFLIGASLSVESIKETGIKPLLLGSILWIVISALSLLIITLIN